MTIVTTEPYNACMLCQKSVRVTICSIHNMHFTLSQVVVDRDNPTEKKLAKLRKKLQQIQELKQRHAKGDKLEENQVLYTS